MQAVSLALLTIVAASNTYQFRVMDPNPTSADSQVINLDSNNKWTINDGKPFFITQNDDGTYSTNAGGYLVPDENSVISITDSKDNAQNWYIFKELFVNYNLINNFWVCPDHDNVIAWGFSGPSGGAPHPPEYCSNGKAIQLRVGAQGYNPPANPVIVNTLSVPAQPATATGTPGDNGLPGASETPGAPNQGPVISTSVAASAASSASPSTAATSATASAPAPAPASSKPSPAAEEPATDVAPANNAVIVGAGAFLAAVAALIL